MAAEHQRHRAAVAGVIRFYADHSHGERKEKKEGQAMSTPIQKEKPSAAGTAKGRGIRPGRRVQNPINHNHHITPARRRQRFFRRLRRLRLAAAGVASLLLLGLEGGVKQNTIGLGSGIAASAITLLVLVWLLHPYMNVPLGKEDDRR